MTRVLLHTSLAAVLLAGLQGCASPETQSTLSTGGKPTATSVSLDTAGTVIDVLGEVGGALIPGLGMATSVISALGSGLHGAANLTREASSISDTTS